MTARVLRAAAALALLAAASAAGPARAEVRRDPFVPVNYVPPAPPAPPEPVVTNEIVAIPAPPPPPPVDKPKTELDIANMTREQLALARKQIVVHGVFQGGSQMMAVINDQIARVGDVLLLTVGERKLRLRVTAIAKQNVVLELVEPAAQNDSQAAK